MLSYRCEYGPGLPESKKQWEVSQVLRHSVPSFTCCDREGNSRPLGRKLDHASTGRLCAPSWRTSWNFPDREGAGSILDRGLRSEKAVGRGVWQKAVWRSAGNDTKPEKAELIYSMSIFEHLPRTQQCARNCVRWERQAWSLPSRSRIKNKTQDIPNDGIFGNWSLAWKHQTRNNSE